MKNNKKVKKIIIIYMAVSLIVSITIPLALITSKNIQQEKTVVSAMETWAKGEEYNGKELPYLWDVKNQRAVEKKAGKIVKEIKSDPEKLVYFLHQLEKHWYKDIDSVEQELRSINFSFDEKLKMASQLYKYGVFYYDLPQITKSEIMNYIEENGEEKLYFKKGEGGFYDGQNNYYDRDTVGLKGSPLYDADSIEYYGDFKTTNSYGTRLNKYYQEESYSYTSHYYKDYSIHFYPPNAECHLSGDYLFAFANGEIHILNVTNGEYYES